MSKASGCKNPCGGAVCQDPSDRKRQTRCLCLISFGLGMSISCFCPTGVTLFLCAVILVALGVTLLRH